MTDSQALAEEFDTMAKWTADAVQELGPDHAIPAACRGSGTPAALDWLARQLRLAPGVRLLDSGAGVGGPAELAAQRFQAAPVLAEPMIQACQASARLFDRPVVVAAGQRLPFATGTFDAAWSLGVLCTVEDQLDLLTELRRVVRPGALVGLLAFLRTVQRLPDQPEGNHFPTAVELDGLLEAAGFTVVSTAELADFPAAEPDWQAAADRVEALIESRHRGDHRWQVAQQQEQLIGQLIERQLVAGRLMVLQPIG